MTADPKGRATEPVETTKRSRRSARIPVPPQSRAKFCVPLATLPDVRAEVSRIYREGRSGKLDWASASKATHILGVLSKLIADCEALEIVKRQSEATAAFNREEEERQARDPLYQDLRRIAGLPPLPTGRNGSD